MNDDFLLKNGRSCCNGRYFKVQSNNKVMADPGFASDDPAETLDFTLKPSSPLFALGWQAIPQADIGPTWSTV